MCEVLEDCFDLSGGFWQRGRLRLVALLGDRHLRVCVCVCVYIYIYIERERERGRGREHIAYTLNETELHSSKPLSPTLSR